MISLYDILEAADGQLFGEATAAIFTDFCYDPREVQPGQLFVALKTDKGDGHRYMEQAIKKGASGVMCTNPPAFDTEDVTIIVMRSVEDALMRWTQIVLEKFGTTVIGVTGSVGKSVTKEAIAHVLGTIFNVYTHPGNFNGRFGLPLALGKLTKEHQIAVLEFGTNQRGEIAEMVTLTQPMVGVVTAVNHAHTESLGSLEQIAEEKAELIRHLPPKGLAVLNFDDPLVREMGSETQASLLTIGLDLAEPAFGADLMAYNILVDRYKTGFDLRHAGERYPGRWVRLLGAHQLYAALAALAVGMSYDISLSDGLHALTRFDPLPSRMNTLPGPMGSLLVDDTCSANPEGTLAALEWMRAVKDDRGKAIFVMGDMDELGGYSTLAHQQIGQRAAEIADRVVTMGDLAAETGRAALEAGLPRGQVAITFSAEDAAQSASYDLGPYDIVLVKGSESARMERVMKRLITDQAHIEYLARKTGLYTQVVLERPERPTWIQINMESIAYNTRRVKEIVGDEVALMAVVKANAYGHGAIPVSMTATNNGADYLGVATVNEALELREAGIDAPILILGYTPPWAASHILRHNLTVSLYDPEVTRALNRAAQEADAMILGHVLVDSGAGMLGLLPDEVTLFFRSLRNMDNIQIEGIYTQFSAADQNENYTKAQIMTFESVVDPLLAAGFRFRYVHAANSAAAIHIPESRFNMVRCGIALYGLSPGPYMPVPADFRPALSWKSVIAQVKRLPSGSFIGEGNRYRTQSTQMVAYIPVGYADGFRREPKRWKHVIIKGEYAPILGAVGMSMTAVDVSQIEDVQPGEEVTLIGQQGYRIITIEDAAEYLGTNTYEVISTILAKEPRVK
jgi:alanine racemase